MIIFGMLHETCCSATTLQTENRASVIPVMSPFLAHPTFFLLIQSALAFSQPAAAFLSRRSHAPGEIVQVGCARLSLFTYVPTNFSYWLMPMPHGTTCSPAARPTWCSPFHCSLVSVLSVLPIQLFVS